VTAPFRLAIAQPLAALRRFIDRWLFRLRGAEPAPIVLNQRRVFVLPTRAGYAYGVTVLFLLIGSINYGLGLGYALTFLLAGLGIVSILHTFRNLARLQIEPGRCEPVFAGGTAAFPLVLTNARDEVRPGLAVSLRGGAPEHADVPGGGNATVTLRTSALRRGWQLPDRVKLETTFPLGLIRAWSYIEPDWRCLVYPAPERNPPPIATSASGTDGSTQRSGGADDFAGLRGHQPADSPRHIAWKSVARGAPLVTKQFEGGGIATLWLDWDLLPRTLDTEARLSRLTAYALQADERGLSFGLKLPNRIIPPASGPAHAEACLMALALHGHAPE